MSSNFIWSTNLWYHGQKVKQMNKSQTFCGTLNGKFLGFKSLEIWVSGVVLPLVPPNQPPIEQIDEEYLSNLREGNTPVRSHFQRGIIFTLHILQCTLDNLQLQGSKSHLNNKWSSYQPCQLVIQQINEEDLSNLKEEKTRVSFQGGMVLTPLQDYKNLSNSEGY